MAVENWTASSTHISHLSSLLIVFVVLNSTQTPLFTVFCGRRDGSVIRVPGWQAQSPALHKLGLTAHTYDPSTLRWSRRVRSSRLSWAIWALFPQRFYTPCWEVTGSVLGGLSFHFTLTEVLPLWLDNHVCTSSHDLPSHLTWTYLCAMLRLKPRTHTC